MLARRAPAPVRPIVQTRAMATRSVVTFLFTDIEDGTRMWEGHPDAMEVALARHDALLCRAIEEGGGVVFKTVGDATTLLTEAADVARAVGDSYGLERAVTTLDRLASGGDA